jgi:UDP-N-acetylglucosamine 2-epimerase (non-hydrolysing)
MCCGLDAKGYRERGGRPPPQGRRSEGSVYAPRMPLIVEIAAARPNFMKVAPIHRALTRSTSLEPVLVHAGQHYDRGMSEVFFADLEMDEPDIRLDAGSGTHAEQTARVLVGLEPHLMAIRPAAVVVVGDVNSTLAAALCAAKLDIPVAHVEAGLRSHRRDMPEEINRVMTDSISDLLFAPSADAVENLLREGHDRGRIHMVGNVMIDSLEHIVPRALASTIVGELGLEPGSYYVATLHRPSNVDDVDELARLVDIFVAVARALPLVFVVHPRTMRMLSSGEGATRLRDAGVMLIEPMGYVEFLSLMATCAAVLTDSGGIQEETTILGVPCLTLRDETERPITVTEGTNHVVGQDEATVLEVLDEVRSTPPTERRPPLWDGHAAERIVGHLEGAYG